MAAIAVRLALLAVTLARTGTWGLNRPDTHSYLEPGRNLLLHGQFAAGGLPELARTPGYALFLAFVSLAGPIAASLAQVALSALSVVLVGRLARRVFRDDSIALAAAWIFAFEPLSVIYSILLLSETLFLTLFLLCLERLVEFLREHRLPVLAAGGLWLAAATFVRPVTYYLPAALAVGLFLALARSPYLLTRRHRPGLRWKAPAVLLLSVVLWLAGWQARNHFETGFDGFSSIQAQNLYYFIAADVNGSVEHRSLAQEQNELGYNDERLFLERHPIAAGWNQAQRIEFMRAAAVRVLRAHPGVFLRKQFEGSARTALNPGAAVLLSFVGAPVDGDAYTRERDEGPARAALRIARTYPWQAALMVAMETALLTLYAFAARGSVRGGAPGSCLWLLLGVTLYFLAVSGGVVGEARLRLPIMPAICILAAAGAIRRNKISHRASFMPVTRCMVQNNSKNHSIR